MFKNLRLGAKLMGGFLAVTALALLLGTVSLVGIGRVRDKAESVAENNFPSLMGLGLLNVGISDMRRIELGLSAATRSANGRWRAAIRAEWDSVQVKELKRGRELYEPLARTAEEDKLWQEYNAAFKTYEAHFEAMQQALLAGDIAAADTLAGAGLPKFQAANRPLMALVDLTDKYVTTNAAALTGEARLARILTWVGSALALVLGVILAISLTRAIVRPLSEVVERTERLREADLANLEQGLVALSRGDVSVTVESTTASLHTTRQDEIGDLARTVDGMIAQTRASVVGYGRVQQTLGRLVSETGALTTAARMGRLEARGATDGFEGTYEQLVAAVNDTLDAVLAPVKETSAALERLAERDLTIRVTGEYVGEHATIKNAFNTAVSNLENALAQVASASQQVAAAGSQITSASTSLAGDANEQASSLEEVSSSLHEIAATVQHTAENSSTVQAMMQLVGKEMGGVTESMERLTGAVNEIESGAQRTAKIVKTIDEIAFQTNLLALNAAVEAARAGEAGRGFAVVAEEVRALALRSAEAAKQTAELIHSAVASAGVGVKLNAEALAGISRVGELAVKHLALADEIAAAAKEQADGLRQVSAGTEQMNAVTQRTAANAEESASTAEELASQAAGLQELVAGFRLGHQRAVAAAPRPQPQPRVTSAPAPPPRRMAAAAAPARRIASMDPESVIPFHDDGDDDTLQEF